MKSSRLSMASASTSGKPVRESNRCNLEPLKPETPRITPYLVFAHRQLTLQVAYLGLAHFRLLVRFPKSHSPPIHENLGRPCGGLGQWIVPEGEVAESTARAWPRLWLARRPGTRPPIDGRLRRRGRRPL